MQVITRKALQEVVYLLKLMMVYTMMSMGCFLMLRIVLLYTSFQNDVQFLARKQAYIHDPVWMMAFYIHVFSAIVALGAGWVQFSGTLLREHRALHRLLGKIYVIDILLINVPVGLILAINANGGILGKTAFTLLDICWGWFTWQAYFAARQREFARHRRFMIRSYAMTLVALTLRTWKVVLTQATILDPATIYIMEAWLGFLPNLLVAEWYLTAEI